MISVSKFSKIVAGIAALAVTAATFAAVPALAATPVTPSFTVTNDVTHQALTNFVATQGAPVDETYTINFNDAGWVFGTPGSGYGYSVGGFYNNGTNIGINAALTLSNDKKTFSLHLSGTPTTGWYQTGTVYLQDDNALQYTYKFNVEVAGTTPTPHISVDGTSHTFGDVTNFLTAGLFASMPQLFLDRKDNSPLIPITNPSDAYSTTQVLDGTTTISYTSDPLYNDPTYGNVRASVVITLNDGVASYSVTTWSETYEGQPIAAGDVLLKSALVRGVNAATTDLTGGARSVFYIGSPYAVFESQSNSLDTATGIETGTSASSDLAHTFKISFYDYSGCPVISELDAAKVAATLPVTGYISNASCAAYLPVFNFTDFGNKTVGDNVAWDASAKYGPYTYTVDSGSLPAGLTLNASTGAITGTATTAGDYSFTIKANKTLAFGIQGYFGTINAVPGPAPVLALSTHTLAEGGSLTASITGDPTGYALCAFMGTVVLGCGPSSGVAGEIPWEGFYSQFGPGTLTLRLYSPSQLPDPVAVTWEQAYTTGDYVDVAIPNVPKAVIDLAATAVAYNAVDLSWKIPAQGYAPITSYKVYQDGTLIKTIDSTSPAWPAVNATTVDYQVLGLTKSTTYNFKVVAVNESGDSTDAVDAATTPDLSFSASNVAHAVVGTSYSAPVTINLVGFTGNQIQSVAATSGLPSGITLSESCGEGCNYSFAGTATTAGTYNVTLTLTLADSSVITTVVTIVVDAAAVTPPVEQPAAISKDITFAGDSSLLSVAAKASLRKLVGYAKAHKITKVSVTGYTLKTIAAKQSFRSNLGMARANAIAKYLKSLNGKLRVTVVGKGLVNKGRVANVKLQG